MRQRLLPKLFSIPAATFLLALAALAAAPAVADETLTFQEGAAGYADTLDLHLSIPKDFMWVGHKEAEFVTDPENPRFEWDHQDTWGEGSITWFSDATKYGWADIVGLLQFGDIFGDGPDQIPPGATITSATLHLWVDNDGRPGDSANLHTVVVPWDESVRWNTFGGDPGPDFSDDFDHRIELNTGGTNDGEMTFDVTASVAAWSQDPASNHGWLFMPVFAQDVISVSGSALGTVTEITVDLEITTPLRGEIVALLRHEDDTAVLINRPGRFDCRGFGAHAADDYDVTIDDAASTDIHFSPKSVSPLTGSYKPDAFCISDAPLCTTGPPGGLCGKPADGDWILNVTDEYSGGGVESEVVSWTLNLGDGVGSESYSSSPSLTVPKRHRDNGLDRSGKTSLHSSESPDLAMRPKLTVSFVETVAVSPLAVESFPNAGIQNVTVRIPSGANATTAVTVTATSDTPSVAAPNNSPLVFGIGGPTEESLEVSIGTAGTALLTLANDAGLANPSLPVDVGTTKPIVVSPAALYRAGGAPDESVQVTIPQGSNATSPVDVTVTSSDPAVVDLVGGSGGSLPISFAAGAATTQAVTVSFGATGSATLTASDDASAIASGVQDVGVSVEAPIAYEVNVVPYVQLGDAPLGAATDQFVVAWETITLRDGGPDADRFELRYRRVGEPSFTSVPLAPPAPTGSASRLNHSGVVSGLLFDEQYEYEVDYIRNEAVVQTYTGTVATRKTTGPVRFTAFGNSGQGVPSQFQTAALLGTLGTDLHFLLGDHVYNAGEYEHYKPRIFDVYGDMMKDTIFYVAHGNHDLQNPEAATDYVHVPENGPPATTPELSYSFDYGNIHFASVDTNTLPDLAPYVAPWLAADLAASTQPWKIVVAHVGGLSRDPFMLENPESADVRDSVFKAAVENGADLWVAGFPHSMQRYLPITAVIPADPFVEWSSCAEGVGTTSIYPGTGSWARSPGQPNPDPLDAPLALYESEIGIGVFDVDGDTLTATLIDENGATVDSITLTNCVGPQDCQCLVCGDGQTQPPEECDDGGTVSGDGCAATCELEEELFFLGQAQGGTVELLIEGVWVIVATTPGQTLNDIASAVAAAIAADPTLMALGIDAIADFNRIATDGDIQDVVLTDPGLSTTPLRVPSASSPALLLIAIILTLGPALALRRSIGGRIARVRQRRLPQSTT